MKLRNFAVTGVGGYIAPRHLRAIRDTGNCVRVAYDPKDSVGILDQYSLDVDFFTEFERYDRHLEKLRRKPEDERIHYVTICSPNYLHDAHCRHALRIGADVLCEKPLVINPWNLDGLQEIESECGKKINSVLQLRVHPKLIALREWLLRDNSQRHTVTITYITARGKWYFYSWKGDASKSGGIATNIGVHLFDLMIWLFGVPLRSQVHYRDDKRIGGYLELTNADVSWFLSLDPRDLPFEPQPGTKTTFRSIKIDDREVEFTEGFTDLHTRIYEEMIAGRGFTIDDVRPSIELVYGLRHSDLAVNSEFVHPIIETLGNTP